MNRKEFLKKTSLATLFLHSAPILNVFSLGNYSNGAIGNVYEGDGVAAVSTALQKKFDDLMLWMQDKGWLAYLKTLGIILSPTAPIEGLSSIIEDVPLKGIKTMKGFEDYAGNRLISPGNPAMSLLYHLLANPRVRPDGFTENQYADLSHIDVLEDYIYAVKKWEDYQRDFAVDADDLVLAVFAYEYRTAYKTPHHHCADLVFSRTGIGRVGNKPPRYDKINRCFTNNPSGDENDKDIAVTPARYGLFIAKKAKLSERKGEMFVTMKMNQNRIDGKKKDKYYIENENRLDYLIPIRKLFNDDVLLDSQPIAFAEKHLTVKIARVLEDDKYRRNSDTLVKHEAVNSSFWVSSIAEPLIKPVTVSQNSALLIKNKVKYETGNRYFTSKYNGGGSNVVEDIEIYDWETGSRKLNLYKYPRTLPMYLNLSHVVKQDSMIVYVPRKVNGDFERDIYKDLSDVPLFYDNICEGSVIASLKVPPSNSLYAIAQKDIVGAYSIITAPDFFPQVDDFDLQKFDTNPGGEKTSLFFEGGVASLSSCKLSPNPEAFKGNPSNSFVLKETYTSVISHYQKASLVGDASLNTNKGEDGASTSLSHQHNFNSPLANKGYFFSSYLPDMCSMVFAPGWDITYSGNKKERFLSTEGLGAPFVEDMKLCAAMNGMWPAASPDASRTYQGSVTDEDVAKEDWGRNPTAIPLMDDEIGLHRHSAAVTAFGRAESWGWDGEQGPYLEYVGDKCFINFTDLGRADYVENALKGIFDMSKLRKLTSQELIARMSCLQKCIKALDQKQYPNGLTDIWLVSAEKVNWEGKVDGLGIPPSMIGNNNKWATQAQREMKGEGYLYVFGEYTPDKDAAAKIWVDDGDTTKRRRILCKQLYICQVSESKVRFCKFNPNEKLNIESLKWT